MALFGGDPDVEGSVGRRRRSRCAPTRSQPGASRLRPGWRRDRRRRLHVGDRGHGRALGGSPGLGGDRRGHHGTSGRAAGLDRGRRRADRSAASAQSGADLLSVEALATRVDVVGWETVADTEGEPGSVAEVGTPIEHGTVLYTADGVDVVAVVETDPAHWLFSTHALGDVELLESVLVYLGFDPDGLITIDDEVDQATVAAVIGWQESGRPSGDWLHRSRRLRDGRGGVGDAYTVDEMYLAPSDDSATARSS